MRSVEAGASADGVVDRVHTVGHGLVNGRRQVRHKATCVTASLVGDHACPRGNTRNGTFGDT